MMKSSNIGETLGLRVAVNQSVVVANAGSNDTLIDGAWIDRIEYQSAVLFLHIAATMDDGQQLEVTPSLQHAADTDGTGAGPVPTEGYVITSGGEKVTIDAPSGGGTVDRLIRMDVSLHSLFAAMRLSVLPKFLTTNVANTASITGFAILGGARNCPTS